MSAQEPLCVVYQDQPAGCCDPEPQPPAAPVAPTNIAGLSAITYRIGTFTSFRRAMLDQVASADLLFGFMPNQPNPFAQWREGTAGDYQTVFVELWAYLADILTFYQERIANEAFLPTATQRDSLMRLAELLGYRPSPGAAASALLAFTLGPRQVVTIPQGFRVGSRPVPPTQPAVTYETWAALAGRGDHNQIRVVRTEPPGQFAPLSVGTDAPVSLCVVLQGVATRLAPGDYTLAVPAGGSISSKPTLMRVSAVDPHTSSGLTYVTLTAKDDAATSYSGATLYALRIKAAPFGSTAPPWASLPTTLTNQDGQHAGAPYADKNWDSPPTTGWYYVPSPGDSSPDDSSTYIYLDAIYRQVVASTPDAPSWAALVNEGDVYQVFNVTETRDLSRTAYAMTARVTRLRLDGGADGGVKADTYDLRSTVILTGAEQLALATAVPNDDPVHGTTIVLDGLYPNLAAGQQVIVAGSVFGTSPPTPASESGIIASVVVGTPGNPTTMVTLKQAFANAYDPASTVMQANVVLATQGETVRDEVLGSGTGAPLQSVVLKQKPLTYLPTTDPRSDSPVQSTLHLLVNGVEWTERSTLLASLPDAQEYTTAQDNAAQTSVLFGDGVMHGMAPPTGVNNIHARYRKGLGVAGNVDAGAIQQLIDSRPGVQKVTNPLAAYGAADPESADEMRVQAPNSVRTFGRAVSVSDYAAVALTYPGVVKASAAWVRYTVASDGQTLLAIAQPYVGLTVATNLPGTNDGTLPKDFKRKLRAFLDQHRDPNVPLRLAGYTPVYVDVAATVDIDDHCPRQGTYNAVLAALNPGLNPDDTAGYFAFQRLEFGQSIHLSAVYAAIQGVPGVSDAVITTLRRPDLDPIPATVQSDIFVGPTQLAVVANDPSDTTNQRGKLTLTLGTGGYVDT